MISLYLIWFENEIKNKKGPQTYYWHSTQTKCLPRLTNGVGPVSIACADCVCLFQTNMTCSAYTTAGTCQCQYTNQYWSSSLKKCLIYRGYGDSCDSDASPIYLCKTGLTCQLTPTCMCPQTVGNSSCDCLINQYWDGTSKNDLIII